MPPPTAREAATIIRRRFPSLIPQPPPADAPYDAGDDPIGVDDVGTGALELSRLRDERASELRDRLTNNEAAALIPTDGYAQGDPGRRTRSNAVPLSNAFSARRQLGDVEGEMAADPYTGTAEQDRVAGIRSQLDKAALTQMPETANAAKTLAEQNAFANYMKSKGMRMGEFEAASSPAAQAAAEVPLHAQASDVGERLANEKLERDQKLRLSPSLVPGQMPIGGGAGAMDESGSVSGGTIPGYTLPPNMKPLNADESRANQAMGQVAPLVGQLETMLDPTRTEIPNKIGNSAKWAAYKMGLADTPFLGSSNPDPEQARAEDARNQARLQLASMITIIGSAPFIQGSRNYQRIKDIEKHLTDPTASDAFLSNQVQELKRLWPVMQRELIQRHVNPGAPLNFDALSGGAGGASAPAGDMTDPNRGR